MFFIRSWELNPCRDVTCAKGETYLKINILKEKVGRGEGYMLGAKHLKNMINGANLAMSDRGEELIYNVQVSAYIN